MTDMSKLFERQTAWQKGRAALTWPEKVRMAEAIREWVSRLSRDRPPAPTTARMPPGQLAPRANGLVSEASRETAERRHLRPAFSFRTSALTCAR